MFKKFTDFASIPRDQQKDALELKDGTYVLDEPADTTKLEGTLAKVRDELKDARAQLHTATEGAADLQRKLDANDLTGKATDEKITTMLTKWEADKVAAVDAVRREFETKLGDATNRLTVFELDNVLTAQFTAAGGNAKKIRDTLVLAKHDGWTVIDGKPVLKDADGTVQTATPMDYFTKTFKDRLPDFYDGSKASGGGAPANSGPSGSQSGAGKAPTKWTSDERRSFIEANGQGAYRTLLDAELINGTNNNNAAAAAKLT